MAPGTPPVLDEDNAECLFCTPEKCTSGCKYKCDGIVAKTIHTKRFQLMSVVALILTLIYVRPGPYWAPVALLLGCFECCIIVGVAWTLAIIVEAAAITVHDVLNNRKVIIDYMERVHFAALHKVVTNGRAHCD
mgnify:CR=1 FL=1